MQYLSQNDKRWSHLKLGKSSLTMGGWGCTTTCISMLSDYFKCYVSPDLIAGNPTNYTPGGLIIWNALNFTKMRFKWRSYGRNDDLIKACLKDPNRSIMLEVNHGQHWVVAISKNLIGNDYTVLDPWTGKKCNVLATYHNITGAAEFVRA